jgi:hypothetical protein
MKKRIAKLVGTVLMIATLAFSIIQLNTTVAQASGPDDCPSGFDVGCGNCWLTYALVWNQGQTVITECHYDCFCFGGGGGGEPFYIEQVVYLYD